MGGNRGRLKSITFKASVFFQIEIGSSPSEGELINPEPFPQKAVHKAHSDCNCDLPYRERGK